MTLGTKLLIATLILGLLCLAFGIWRDRPRAKR